eukprot:TRINITY_DN5661_c0_g1_i3.p1 TRINITY_DN5661_c0_g1~~TRINITY_DN5661_c0_g1_i3.p1  ORF type:complete len:555 (+),score=111.91 TRINITY_DN5661_c0_g1_i3:27-1667(+)
MAFLHTTQVTFLPSGKKREFPPRSQLSIFAAEEECRAAGKTLVAMKVNGLMFGLCAPLPFSSSTLEPVFNDTPDGIACIKRSLVFLMQMAVFREYGDKLLVTVEHSYGSGGYFCLINRAEFEATDDTVQKLEQRMKQLVEQDLLIGNTKLSHDEALQYFTTRNRPYTASLVAVSNRFSWEIATCGSYADLCWRPLVYRTGCLKCFKLIPHKLGFILQVPTMTQPNDVVALPAYPGITAVYEEGHKWGKVMECECVGHVNERVAGSGQSKTYIALNEAVHNHKIVQVAQDIAARVLKGVKVILIAGPSASGKTTFAAKLSIQLEMLGVMPTTLSVDNYYKPHTECPRDEHGKLDFEVLEALQVDLLNEHLKQLFLGDTVKTPIFDFITGKAKVESKPMKMAPGGVVVIEGIHCLNDKLTYQIDLANKYKIFIAPFAQLNLDESNYISNSLGRLIRRIVRDYNHRGYSAMETLNRWPSVRRGEDLYIFPFMKNADFVFNSSLDYEITVLKTFCKPLLKSVKTGTPNYNMAQCVAFPLLPSTHVGVCLS